MITWNEKVTNNYKIEHWFSSPIISHNAIDWAEKLLQPSLNYLNDDKINRKRFYKGRTTYETQHNLAKQPEYIEFVDYLKSVANTFLTFHSKQAKQAAHRTADQKHWHHKARGNTRACR